VKAFFIRESTILRSRYRNFDCPSFQLRMINSEFRNTHTHTHTHLFKCASFLAKGFGTREFPNIAYEMFRRRNGSFEHTLPEIRLRIRFSSWLARFGWEASRQRHSSRSTAPRGEEARNANTSGRSMSSRASDARTCDLTLS
jgi:hypothetical protein